MCEIFDIYHTLTQVEYAFRCLKTDLGMRPVYHQLADRTRGHLFISVMAYHQLFEQSRIHRSYMDFGVKVGIASPVWQYSGIVNSGSTSWLWSPFKSLNQITNQVVSNIWLNKPGALNGAFAPLYETDSRDFHL